MIGQGLLQTYRAYLPITNETPLITLKEGHTPLIPLSALSEQLDIELYGKIEGFNPTGSFKDRGMALAVAKAVEAGSEAVICASTGNTSASAAAYASKAGIRAIIVIPKGKIALGKLAQAVMYGADIVEIDGDFDDALKIVRTLSETTPVTLVNSVNPYRLDGQKTAAFEICDELGMAPEVLAIPVGNAGNISAYWKGFREYADRQNTDLPEMHGFEAAGAAALTHNQIVANPETMATAIRIGNPASWTLAEAARDESGGTIASVTDEEIANAQRWLARQEGVFAEPGSCASIAGMIRERQAGTIAAGTKVVAVLTGNGLKDPQAAIEQMGDGPVTLPNDEKAVTDYVTKLVKA
ncbi:threonine synthase [Barrientosiimonas marina]|uniref:Threonine synthase n=1 Tax=Lentibacillus kimchii TaxID=1542911 RepID=A0ABW2UW39_9BACI